MMEEKKMEFMKSTSLSIAEMRTRFDEIDEQKIYEKGQRLGKRIGEILGKRNGERIGELNGQRKMLQQILGLRIPMGDKETGLLRRLNGDELLLLSGQFEVIKSPADLEKQVHQIVGQRSNVSSQPDLVSRFKLNLGGN